MGKYLNPGNNELKNHLKNPYYVDKSGLIELLNNRMENNDDRYLCVSRPRRFGKSYAADMLTAYYSRGCKSRKLFAKLKIAKTPTFKRHLNKYDVIHIDVAGFLVSLNPSVSTSEAVEILKNDILFEVKQAYPRISVVRDDLVLYLDAIHSKYSRGFIFVIDEWDAPFRISKNDADGQTAYLRFLQGLFKGNDFVAFAYMTGILPIKKYCTESALNMFKEYTMLSPGSVKEFIGFTEEEVGKLCAGSKFTKQNIKDWYDGYSLDGLDIYNPNSVVSALSENRLDNYWTGTEAFDNLLSYIKLNVDGLHDALLRIFAKEKFVLDVRTTFPGDLV
ncbi:MAG: AAA family ATPase, partial [Clostridia bacterium]|nr:AAA family ATPase [Clostridia bacterium]